MTVATMVVPISVGSPGTGVTLTGTTAFTMMNRAEDILTLPRGHMYIGKLFRITVVGEISYFGQPSGALAVNYQWSKAAITGLAAMGATTLISTVFRNEPFVWEAYCRVATLSTTTGNNIAIGTVVCPGLTRTSGQFRSTTSYGPIVVPQTAPAATTNGDNVLPMITWIGCGLSGDGVNVHTKLHMFAVEELN